VWDVFEVLVVLSVEEQLDEVLAEGTWQALELCVRFDCELVRMKLSLPRCVA
jgi:hypothetical protein